MEPEGLTKKPWYFAKLSRDDAESMLIDKPCGTFLVRKSSQKDRLALSHKHHDGHIVHAIIVMSFQGYGLVDPSEPEPKYSPTVTKLLDSLKFTYHLNGKNYDPVTDKEVDT